MLRPVTMLLVLKAKVRKGQLILRLSLISTLIDDPSQLFQWTTFYEETTRVTSKGFAGLKFWIFL